MNIYVTYARRITLVCLAGAMFLATDGEATSFTHKEALQQEHPGGKKRSKITCPVGAVDALCPNGACHSSMGFHPYELFGRAEMANAWSDLGEDAWPEWDFSGLMDLLPVLQGIRHDFGHAARPSWRPEFDALPAPYVDSSKPLPGQAGGSSWTLRPAWAVTVAELRGQLQQERPPRLIDVRHKEAFARFRLAGSLNIQPFALKTKRFLKRRAFVLLDEGYEPQRLERMCEELQQAGFEAQFLYGGLNAWNASGEKLEGEPSARRTLDRLPPSAFRDSLTDKRRLVVALDETLPVTGFPQVVRLHYSGNPQEWLRQLERTAARWTDQPELSSVVLLSRAGDEYAALEGVLRSSRLPNIFLLDGGLQAYQDLLSREIVARERGTASTDSPAGCPDCRLSCQ